MKRKTAIGYLHGDNTKRPGVSWYLRKFLRFTSIYGPRRSLYKAAGRLRITIPHLSPGWSKPDIGIVGCGQFAFSTIGYFLLRECGKRILTCYDIDTSARDSFAKAMSVLHVANTFPELINRRGLRVVYVASNHASHTYYAVEALRLGLTVYVEKPIAVSHVQLMGLVRAMQESQGKLFAGYNRPFSAAVRLLRQTISIDGSGGMSMQCFVAGHRIGPQHWYRRAEEGTRICGNLGHWLDLFIHVLSWRGMPNTLHVSLTIADEAEPDDNLVVGLRSELGDICSIMLSSRSEPFEGINETISIQHGETLCKIDDFRHVTIWRGEKVIRKRFWPKDVGHKLAVLQPFREAPKRDWNEVLLSTLLMLHIADMVRSRIPTSIFSFEESRKATLLGSHKTTTLGMH